MLEMEDCSAVYAPDTVPLPDWAMAAGPISATSGPMLLLDDYFIAMAAGQVRVVMSPERDPAIANPIVDGSQDRNFQPFFTVDRRPEDGRWRLWYGGWVDRRQFSVADLYYMESDDGIHWIRPPRKCAIPPVQFGSEVIDRGPAWGDPQTRYFYTYWLRDVMPDGSKVGGTHVAVSADGFTFRRLVPDRPVIVHNHDITNIWCDPIRRKYLATWSIFREDPRWQGSRRTTAQCVSDDLVHWSQPWFALRPDPRVEEGDTQFYAMNGYLARGPVVVGMVKVLRDDLRADGVQEDAFGLAPTVLAWSYDGRHWLRDPQNPFLKPDPDPLAFDHAHAWIDEQVLVGDELYLYYCGYRQGHKANRHDERQLGLLRMARDRYVARRAIGDDEAVLRTSALTVDHTVSGMQINANVTAGQLTVQIMDAAGQTPIPGLAHTSCRPISGNNLRHVAIWDTQGDTAARLSALAGRQVTVEFRWRGGDLYAFELMVEREIGGIS